MQNPNARFHEEGTLGFSYTVMQPYLRGSIVAYPFNWLEASYQYADINNQLYSTVFAFSGNQTFKDKSFDFVIKTPPAAVQLLEATKIKKGSGEPNREKVASVSWDQIKKIAEDKMVDLNAFTVESAMRMVAGTARSMGIKVNGEQPPVSK